MLLNKILRQVVAIVEPLVKKLETQVKAWTKPTTDSLVGKTEADLMKNKEQLIYGECLAASAGDHTETASGSSAVDSQDHGLLVVLASRVKDRTNAVLIAKPDTVLRWHRKGFKLFWRRKSKEKARKLRISEKTIALIKQKAIDNRRWGGRIRG